MTPRRSLPLGLFGLICLAVAITVLAGVRQGSWSVLSWLIPVGLVGTGVVALVGARRRSEHEPTG